MKFINKSKYFTWSFCALIYVWTFYVSCLESNLIYQPQGNIHSVSANHLVYNTDRIVKTSDSAKKQTRRSINVVSMPKVYHLTIGYHTVNITGQSKQAMLVTMTAPSGKKKRAFLPPRLWPKSPCSNCVAGPILHFKEGQRAIIYVTNKMDVETSVHWHGILLPNFQDGVPYLTTPSIQPGKTHKYEFTLKQSGTYWYHSHTGLQEQRGVHGAIVVEPKRKRHWYHHDLVLVLSDWTDENPYEVLRALKRGNEWYSFKKDTALSLSRIIRGGALLAHLRMQWQIMPGVDISDVYYPAFLINGQKSGQYYFKSGRKIRLRVINAAASTYFWLSFGGKAPLLISADGINVKPFRSNKILHAIAETYDFLITVPQKEAVELKAFAQDGTGFASVEIGSSTAIRKKKVQRAPIIPKPDLIQLTKDMAYHSSHTSSQTDHKQHSNKEKHKHHQHKSKVMRNPNVQTTTVMHSKGHTSHSAHKKHGMHKRDSVFSYENLKSLRRTVLPSGKKLLELHLNLTGNMARYIWSLNGQTLSQADKIQIKKGETVRLHLNNTTMMHHPMHLHGHFFRVLNQHKAYSPLKHTVDVPPMKTVSIEFAPKEEGDWFFHCHILYHMKSGMARVFSHGNQRDMRLTESVSGFFKSDNQWYWWGEANILSNYSNVSLVTSNIKNLITLDSNFSWGTIADVRSLSDVKNLSWSEAAYLDSWDLSYRRFVTGLFQPYLSLDLLGAMDSEKESMSIGFRYIFPLAIILDMSLNGGGDLSVGLEYETLLFYRTDFFAEVGWVFPSVFASGEGVKENQMISNDWAVGFSHAISKNISAIAEYSSALQLGVGIHWKF